MNWRKSAIDESYRYRFVWTLLNDYIPYLSLFLIISVLLADKYGSVSNLIPYIILIGSFINSILITFGYRLGRILGTMILPICLAIIWIISESEVRASLGILAVMITFYSIFDAIISDLSEAPRPVQRTIGYMTENLNRFAWMFICLLFIADSFETSSIPTIKFLNLQFADSTADYFLIVNLSAFILTLVLSVLMLVWRNEQLRSVSQKLKLISSWNIHEDTVEKDLLQNDESELKHVNRTILFGDIRGFTSFSEKNPITEVVNVLNSLYNIVEQVLSNYDKAKPEFIADEFIIFFENPEKAVSFASEVIKKLDEVLGAFELSVGIGVDNGDIIEGIVGSTTSKKYTGFGSAVNTASRLQGIAEGNEILVSKAVVERVPKATFKFKDDIQLKGIATPFPVYKFKKFQKVEGNVVNRIKSRIQL